MKVNHQRGFTGRSLERITEHEIQNFFRVCDEVGEILAFVEQVEAMLHDFVGNIFECLWDCALHCLRCHFSVYLWMSLFLLQCSHHSYLPSYVKYTILSHYLYLLLWLLCLTLLWLLTGVFLIFCAVSSWWPCSTWHVNKKINDFLKQITKV